MNEVHFANFFADTGDSLYEAVCTDTSTQASDTAQLSKKPVYLESRFAIFLAKTLIVVLSQLVNARLYSFNLIGD